MKYENVMNMNEVQREIITDNEETFNKKLVSENNERKDTDVIKYTEAFLNKKKIELQQEKERFVKKQKELKRLKDEVRKLKKELLEDINSY